MLATTLRKFTVLSASIIILNYCQVAACEEPLTPATIESFDLIKTKAEAGNPEYQTRLGNSYCFGLGINQDYSEALRWFRKAADLKHPEAMLRLGQMYDEGIVVEQNDIKALKWYRLAADQ